MADAENTTEEVEQLDDTEETEAQTDDEDEATGDDTEDEGDDGAESLGDAGKKALDAMKAKWRSERDKRRDIETKLAEATKTDEPDPAAEALAKANRRILRSEIKAAAAGRLHDPADAFVHLDLDKFEVDDDGNVDEDEIADAISELTTSKPYLAVQDGRRFKGDAGGGARKESGPKQLTQADLEGMSPEAITAALKEGRLSKLIN